VDEWLKGLPHESGYWFLFFLAEVTLAYAWRIRAKLGNLLTQRPTVKSSATSITLTASSRANPTVIKLGPLSATVELREATVSRGRAPLLSAAEEIFEWWLRMQ
jgi:hypothetical protein